MSDGGVEGLACMRCRKYKEAAWVATVVKGGKLETAFHTGLGVSSFCIMLLRQLAEHLAAAG
jgi:hypothetical protein